MRRRTTAVVAALVLAAVAGCLGVGSSPANGAPESTAASGAPDSTPATVTTGTPVSCSGDESTPGFGLAERLPSRAEGFELAASDRTLRRGERVTFSLTNVADEPRGTGTAKRYALQRRVFGGWETVTLFRSSGMGFNTTAVQHDPGTGFAWSFRASAAGFTRGKYVVCEPLTPGTYRFVFAGPAVAVRFEIRS